MQEYFIRMLNMSLTGAVVIVAVLLLRLLLRRVPKIFSYSLWAVVLFRLLCPISFSLPVSLLGTINAPAAQQGTVNYIPQELLYGGENLTAQGNLNETADRESLCGDKENSVSGVLSPGHAGIAGRFSEESAECAGIIWCMGTVAMLLYGGICLAVFKRSLKGARKVEGVTGGKLGDLPGGRWPVAEIYCKEALPTSFVLGIIRPRIYLPEGMSGEEQRYVLLHEQIHIRRGDPVFRLAGYLALCVHWFNPLVWAAFILSGRDMEMSCDEAVIRRLGSGVKREYSASLLSMATGRRMICGAPLAFGEGDTGSRIRNILNYKKPGTILVCLAAVAGLLAAVFLLANPAANEEPEDEDTGEMLISEELEDDGTENRMESEAEGGSDAARKPEGSEEALETASVQVPDHDFGEAFPFYDTTESKQQREILQSMDRGEKLTPERLKELLEEPEPLLESYAGYRDSSWEEAADGDSDAYLTCLMQNPETGVDLKLRIRYDMTDNSILSINLERRNDALGIGLYNRDSGSFGYTSKWPEDMDAICGGMGDLFLWIEQYRFPASNENNIYISIRPEQFWTDLDGWSGMTYQWLGEEGPVLGSREWGPKEWKAAASIIRIPADCLIFTDGTLSQAQLDYNHAERVTEWEPVERCEGQAAMCMMNVDQYTIPELDEAEEAGSPIPEEYQTADIWYICIGREDSPWGYMITMNQRHFSKEEAVEFAQSIRFRDAAWE